MYCVREKFGFKLKTNLFDGKYFNLKPLTIDRTATQSHQI